MERKCIMHRGRYGNPICRNGKVGENITHSIYVKINCPDCLKLLK